MKNKSFWFLLFLFLFLYVEYKIVWLLVNAIGPISVMGLLFCFFFIGMHLLRMNFNAWRNARIQLNGEPNADALNCVILLIAAILLIIPGVITSLVGLLLILPPVRRKIIHYLQDKSSRRGNMTDSQEDDDLENRGEPEVIDVEAHETKSTYEERH